MTSQTKNPKVVTETSFLILNFLSLINAIIFFEKYVRSFAND